MKIIQREFTFRDDFYREYKALIDCRSVFIQEIVDVNVPMHQLYLKFYENAVPLDHWVQQTRLGGIKLLPQIFKSVYFCHQQGWIHGDLKLSNILYLPQDNQIKLIDFGGCQRIDTAREDLPHWQYTHAYARENVIKGCGKVHPFDDWYACIHIMKHMLFRIFHV